MPEHIQKLENLTIYKADIQPEYEISLEPDLTFRDTGEVLFGRIIRQVEVDGNGRTYILDYTEKTIHVFNPEGQYLDSIGREGRGPGEFLRVADIQVDAQSLHVLDLQQTKISVFNTTDFEHQRDIIIGIDEQENKPSWLERTRNNRTFYRPNDFFPLSDGHYLVVFSDNGVAMADNLPGRTYEFSSFDPDKEAYNHGLLSFDWTGAVLVHDYGQQRTLVLFDVPYKRKSAFDVENGKLVYGWTEHFLFKVYDEEGSYQHAFYYPFEKEELTEEKALGYYNEPNDNLRAAIRNDTLPATFPAFNSMLLDNNQRLWVTSVTDNPAEYQWRVLSLQGELLAQFRWPRGRSIKAVKGDYVYTIEYNQQTGTPKVDRYAMELR